VGTDGEGWGLREEGISEMTKAERHQKLVDAVMNAIEDLFSDTRVSRETTYADLKDVIDACNIKIGCLKSDGLKE